MAATPVPESLRLYARRLPGEAGGHRSDIGEQLGFGQPGFRQFGIEIVLAAVAEGDHDHRAQALVAQTERRILDIVASEPGVHEPHNLRTRRIGTVLAMEVHIRVDGRMSVARFVALSRSAL